MSKLTPERLEEWANLPTILKDQINENQDYFLEADDNKLAKLLKNWSEDLVEIKYRKKYSNSDELNYFAIQSLIFTKVSALQAARSERFRRILCYDQYGNGIIQLEKQIANGSNVIIIEGRFTHPHYRPRGYNSDRVVVKLYESTSFTKTGKVRKRANTQYEINQYRELKDPIPSLGMNCWFWNVPVLIMQPMEKVGINDNEIEIGRQIVKQMSKLHAWKPHSDVKPLNIMRVPNTHIYTLIDLGGCPKERKSDGIGWRRRTWSSKWTDARQGDRLTNADDLRELGITLNAMRYCRERGLEKYPSKIYKISFSPLWSDYMRYVDTIDDTTEIDYTDHYHALLKILNVNNNNNINKLKLNHNHNNRKNDNNNNNGNTDNINNNCEEKKNKNIKHHNINKGQSENTDNDNDSHSSNSSSSNSDNGSSNSESKSSSQDQHKKQSKKKNDKHDKKTKKKDKNKDKDIDKEKENRSNNNNKDLHVMMMKRPTFPRAIILQ